MDFYQENKATWDMKLATNKDPELRQFAPQVQGLLRLEFISEKVYCKENHIKIEALPSPEVTGSARYE
jgi:hypothetical protein